MSASESEGKRSLLSIGQRFKKKGKRNFGTFILKKRESWHFLASNSLELEERLPARYSLCASRDMQITR